MGGGMNRAPMSIIKTPPKAGIDGVPRVGALLIVE